MTMNSFASVSGRTPLSGELHLFQVGSRTRSRGEADVPKDVGLLTKGRLEYGMLERVVNSRVPFGLLSRCGGCFTS